MLYSRQGIFMAPIVAFVAGATLLAGPVFASCWNDQRIAQQASSIANRLFADVAQRMPTVVVCTGDTFAPRIGGDFNGGHWRIRIPDWQLQRQELPMVLAHELAHAQVHLNGLDDGFAGGHGKAWMQAMISVGLSEEAIRTAREVPGAQLALAQAQQMAPDQEPLPAELSRVALAKSGNAPVCYYQSRVLKYRELSGQIVTHTLWNQVCKELG